MPRRRVSWRGLAGRSTRGQIRQTKMVLGLTVTEKHPVCQGSLNDRKGQAASLGVTSSTKPAAVSSQIQEGVGSQRRAPPVGLCSPQQPAPAWGTPKPGYRERGGALAWERMLVPRLKAKRATVAALGGLQFRYLDVMRQFALPVLLPGVL